MLLVSQLKDYAEFYLEQILNFMRTREQFLCENFSPQLKVLGKYSSN